MSQGLGYDYCRTDAAMGDRRVVITGMGTLCPLGLTTESFWQACLAGKQAVAHIPDNWLAYADFTSRYWAPLPEIDFADLGISRVDALRLDPVSKLSLVAADQALADAGVEVRPLDRRGSMFEMADIDPERAGVIMGTGIGGLNTTLGSHAVHVLNHYHQALEKIIAGVEPGVSFLPELQEISRDLGVHKRYNPFTVSMLMCNSVSANIAIRYRCLGDNHAISLACASGTAALGKAFEAVRSGRLDFVMSGGAEYVFDETGAAFRGYDIAATLAHGFATPEEANRPFDARHNGFLFSEGAAAVLVLEEKQAAVKRGANIIAEISAYAESFDGESIMRPSSDGSQVERMIRSALEDASLTASDIDYINAHGTGTIANDEMECRVIERLFGARPAVNSTKSFIGHTLGASGALEAQVVALSIRDQKTHANANLDTPISDINLLKKKENLAISSALTQSFAFGGHNCALVLKKPR